MDKDFPTVEEAIASIKADIEKVEKQIEILKINLDIKKDQLTAFKADLESLKTNGEISGDYPKLPHPEYQVRFWGE